MRTLSWFFLMAVATCVRADDAFDRQCDTLAVPPIDVAVRTHAPNIVHDRPFAEVAYYNAEKGLGPQAAYTDTKVSWDGRLALEGLEKPGDEVVCAKVRMQIDFTLDAEIVMGREVYENACLFRIVMGHELEHVEIAEANLRMASEQIQRELKEAFDTRRMVGRKALLVEDVNLEIEQRWKPRLWQLIAEGEQRHQVLDDRDKADALNVCNGALRRIFKSLQHVRPPS